MWLTPSPREIIPPAIAYEGLEQVGFCYRENLHLLTDMIRQAFLSRNFLSWMADLESKLRLKNLSSHMMSIAVARNRLIPDLENYAEREVRAAPICKCVS